MNCVATPEVIVKLMHSMKTMHLSLATMAQSTVIDVKEMLQKEWNILPKDQALIYDGLKLPDEFKLCDCGVTEGCELDLVVSSAHCKFPYVWLCMHVIECLYDCMLCE